MSSAQPSERPGRLWALPILLLLLLLLLILLLIQLLLLLSHEGRQEEESHFVQELEQEGGRLSWQEVVEWQLSW